MLKNRLHKIYVIIIFSLAFLFCNLITLNTYAANEPTISAGSAILIDNRTNKILYGKNENERMYPASTTKIMTAILSLEKICIRDRQNVNWLFLQFWFG